MFWRVVMLALIALIGMLLGLLELISLGGENNVEDTESTSVDA